MGADGGGILDLREAMVGNRPFALPLPLTARRSVPCSCSSPRAAARAADGADAQGRRGRCFKLDGFVAVNLNEFLEAGAVIAVRLDSGDGARADGHGARHAALRGDEPRRRGPASMPSRASPGCAAGSQFRDLQPLGLARRSRQQGRRDPPPARAKRAAAH